MDVTEFITALRRRWRLVLACVVMGCVGAAVVTWQTPATYTATTQSFVTVGGDTSSGGVYQESQFTVQRVKSYTELVSSPLVLEPVIEELGLAATPAALARRVRAESPLSTVLIEVTATDQDPTVAATIADAATLQLGEVVEDLEAASSDSSTVAVTLTRPAVAPQQPTSPRPPLNLALGMVIGLALGLGAALLRDRLDTTVRGRHGLVAALSVPHLGSVFVDRALEQGPVGGSGSESPTIEQFRTIRTNLKFVDVDTPATSVVVTSAGPSEGKTTTVCNLSVAMAQPGVRVCVVDADLRRPMVADYLGLEGAVGLTDVVIGAVDLKDAVLSWGDGQLSVLPAGRRPPDANSLLASRSFERTMGELQEQYDVVIYDAPPLGAVTDAALLAKKTDGAVFVVRHGRARRSDVAEAVRELELARARVLGTVLTFAPRGSASTYAYGEATPAPRWWRRVPRRAPGRGEAPALLPVGHGSARDGHDRPAGTEPTTVPAAKPATGPAAEQGAVPAGGVRTAGRSKPSGAGRDNGGRGPEGASANGSKGGREAGRVVTARRR